MIGLAILWENKAISFPTKIKLYKSLVLSILRIQPFETNATEECLAYHTESIKQTNKRICVATGRYPRRTSGAITVNRKASQAIMVRPSLSSWYVAKDYNYKEQWMICVADKDLVNHGRTTSRNGQISRCRYCFADDKDRWAIIAADASIGALQRRLGVTVVIS